MGFGKYANVPLADVPTDYLEWMIERNNLSNQRFQNELERRAAVELQSLDDTERIVRTGFRELAKKAHPDQGGSNEAFLALRSAYEALLVAVKTMKEVRDEQ